jgi:hypothetical protein
MGTPSSGGLGFSIAQFLDQLADVRVEVSQHLLAMRVADRDGSHP